MFDTDGSDHAIVKRVSNEGSVTCKNDQNWRARSGFSEPMPKRERNRFVPGEIRIFGCHFGRKSVVSDKRGVNGLGSKVKRHNTLSHSCLCLETESDFD